MNYAIVALVMVSIYLIVIAFFIRNRPVTPEPLAAAAAVTIPDPEDPPVPSATSRHRPHPAVPSIVFCTTCKGRRQHVEATLPRNMADNADYPAARFVLLDYASDDDLGGYLDAYHGHQISYGRLAYYRHLAPGPFKMAHAKNMAHRLGILEGADVVVNLDADNYTGPGFAAWLADEFRHSWASPREEIFLWARMIPGRLGRGVSGRIAVSAHAFLNAGGYDERYSTWAPDDKDFNVRLQRLGYLAREIDPRFLDAIHHKDKLRFKEYPHARPDPATKEDEFYLSTDSTVVNYGDLGCGDVYRNFSPTPVSLAPLATRLFGIGLHKTGTNSLHAALETLGYDSAHWGHPKKAKAIWLEMLEHGRSRTLERHYATSDLPIPLLYPDLDRAYPGSKFILTIRDESRWLASVEAHWSYDRNRYRASWDTDPITHTLHQSLYGRRDFDGETFVARYRRHNAEVREYFADRPQDLLVMRMDEGAGYHELCAFLGNPLPPVPYPREYANGGAE